MYKMIKMSFFLGVFSIVSIANAQTTAELTENMTFQQMVDGANGLVIDATGAVEEIAELAEEVQEDEGNVTQLRCVNDSLVSMNGFLQVADEAAIDLQSAEGASVEQDHYYELVVISHRRVMVLRSEARQCAGEVVRYTGDTQLNIERPDILPTADPTIPPPLFDFIAEGVIIETNIPDASPGLK